MTIPRPRNSCPLCLADLPKVMVLFTLYRRQIEETKAVAAKAVTVASRLRVVVVAVAAPLVGHFSFPRHQCCLQRQKIRSPHLAILSSEGESNRPWNSAKVRTSPVQTKPCILLLRKALYARQVPTLPSIVCKYFKFVLRCTPILC